MCVCVGGRDMSVHKFQREREMKTQIQRKRERDLGDKEVELIEQVGE